jgi:hypothetical protein
MKISSLLLLGMCTIFLWTGCKKKGCTNQYSDNYNPDSLEDDGSCVFTTLESIIDVPWHRETDSVLYSFTLNSDGTWTTDKDCNPRTEGTWEVNYETSTLYHYFNGIQEEYDVIEPSSTTVKFRGGSNSNSDIAPNNSLLVYQSQYTPSFIGVKNSYINLISQTTDITVTQTELSEWKCPYTVSDFESADIKYNQSLPIVACAESLESDVSENLIGLDGFSSYQVQEPFYLNTYNISKRTDISQSGVVIISLVITSQSAAPPYSEGIKGTIGTVTIKTE